MRPRCAPPAPPRGARRARPSGAISRLAPRGWRPERCSRTSRGRAELPLSRPSTFSDREARACPAALLAATPAAAAPSSPAGLPACALGRLPAALRTAMPNAIAEAQRRFGATLRDSSAADRAHAEADFAAAEAAYLYGMPTVRPRLTVQRFPVNQFLGIGELAGPQERAVVAPNRDTLYSVSQLSLANGPLVIDAPATGGRYSVIQLLDAYTNDFAYIGAGAERDTARSVALVPPGWQGALPDGGAADRQPDEARVAARPHADRRSRRSTPTPTPTATSARSRARTAGSARTGCPRREAASRCSCAFMSPSRPLRPD